ncbi:hypothetical protein HOI71_21415, partial [Candidatus Poribacteria bacterium]|nr:hypothetical protein [Candidatus Poribacteria bacterium]
MTLAQEEQLARRQAIRVATADRLAAVGAGTAEAWGRCITSTVLGILDDRGASTVFTYLNMPEEAPTHDIVRALLA